MRLNLPILTICAAALACSAHADTTHVIDFETGLDGLSDYDNLPSDYGSLAGVLDVTFDGNSSAAGLQSFAFFGPDTLGFPTNSAAGNGQPSESILFTPLGGRTVTLTSFQMSAYPGYAKTLSYYVEEIGGTGVTIFGENDGAAVSDTVVTTYSSDNPGTIFTNLAWTTDKSLLLTFSNLGYGEIGIDNITLTISDAAPVPVPATLPLLLGALGVGGFALRRRRA